MLRLIPAPLHRLGYRMASTLRARWRGWFKPSLRGCSVVAFDDEGRVAFVRLSYGKPGWSLPGGGLGRREDALDGARREFREETGCSLVDPAVVVIRDVTSSGAPNRVHIVAGQAAGTAACDGREVIEIGWFAADALPEPMSPRLRENLPDWITAARAAGHPAPAPPPAPPPAPTA